VTTAALVVLASCAVAAILAPVVRCVAVRLRGTADVGDITVSRQWLIQHQSNDRL
jgi:hypothetical protein